MGNQELNKKAQDIKSDLHNILQEKGINKTDARFNGVMTQFDEAVKSVLEDSTLDDDSKMRSMDTHKAEFEAWINGMPGGARAVEAMNANTGEFVGGVEAVAALPESEEDGNDLRDEVEAETKRIADEEREKRREEFAKNKKGRSLKSDLRAVKAKSLEAQKSKYDKLKGAGFNRRSELLDDIQGLKKQALVEQLKAYERNDINLSEPPGEYADEIKSIQKQLKDLSGSSEGEEPNMEKLEADMEKAKDVMRRNKVIALEEPPSIENLQKNFSLVDAGQANIEKASAYLQASFVEANKLVAKGRQAAEEYDVVDEFWPWDTENNTKVNEANESLKDIQKDIHREYNPLLNDMATYKGTVLAAADALYSQAKSLSGGKTADVEKLKQRKEDSLAARAEKESESKEARKSVFEKNIVALQKAHEAKLQQIKTKKEVVMTVEDGQQDYLANQKQVLDEQGKELSGRQLTHDAAKAGVEEAISVLKDKLKEEGLSAKVKKTIEDRIKILEDKSKYVDGSKQFLGNKLTELGAMDARLYVAGTNLAQQSFNALANLNSTENILIVDFAQQISGMNRTYEKLEELSGVQFNEDTEALTAEFDDNIEMGVEQAEFAKGMEEEAGLHKLELEVASMSVFDNLTNQRDQLANAEKVDASAIDSLWNTVTVKRVFTSAYDLMGLDEDNWFRKNVNGLNPLGFLWPPAFLATPGILASGVEQIEKGAAWLDGKLGISDGYKAAIEWMKDHELDALAAPVDFVVDLGVGLTQLVTHPVDTVKGIWDLATSPSKWPELGKALIEFDEFGKGNYVFGGIKVLGNILLTATGVGAVGTGLKAGATGANVATKMGRFAKYTAIDFAKNAPRAVWGTGKFLVTTPFKLASNFTKLTIGAAKGELPAAINAMKQAGRTKKIIALQGEQNSLVKQLSKVKGATTTNLADNLKSAFTTHSDDLAAAVNEMKTTVMAGADDVAKVYAEVLFKRYFNNAARMQVMERVRKAMLTVKGAASVGIVEVGGSVKLNKAMLDELENLVARHKTVDELTVGILNDSKFGLDMTNPAHVAAAKGLAEAVKDGTVNLKRYLKAIVEPVGIDDLIAKFQSAGAADDVTKLGKIKSGTITPSVNFTDPGVVASMKKYAAEERFLKSRSVEELAKEILDDWNASLATGATSHFDEAKKISDALEMADRLIDQRKAILPPAGTALDELKAALTDVNLLTEATPAARPGTMNWATNKVASYEARMTALESTINDTTKTIEQITAAQKEFDKLTIYKGLLQARKVHMVVSWPISKVGGVVVDVLAGAGAALKLPLNYAFSTVTGTYVFTVDTLKPLGRELVDLIKSNKAAGEAIFNKAGQIEFVAKNARELEVALRKVVIMATNKDDIDFSYSQRTKAATKQVKTIKE